jgi:hypothetical protein
MKILSKASSSFKIDGVTIVPGIQNYKKIDPSKPWVKYQLGILKADGIIDFNELIEAPDKKALPIESAKQGLEAVVSRETNEVLPNGKRVIDTEKSKVKHFVKLAKQEEAKEQEKAKVKNERTSKSSNKPSKKTR